MKTKDLSIVIPTRNRPETLLFTLESIKSNLSKVDYELVIASNGESLETDLLNVPPELLGSAKIVRSEQRLSMGDNWRFGFTYTSGKWVHIMGDDDCIALNDSEKLSDILKRDDIDGLVFRSGNFCWAKDQNGKYSIESVWEPEVTSEILKIECKGSTLDRWEDLHPRDYPSSTGRTLMKREYLSRLEANGHLFNAVSPDWFTGAYFAFSNSTFLKCDLLWANIGQHPTSSVFQMQNPRADFSKKEAKLQRYQVHKSLESQRGEFPTTWLVRMDSILRAREVLGLNITISEFQIIRGALETTPGYVWRVSKQLVQDKPSRIFLVSVIGLYEQFASFSRWIRGNWCDSENSRIRSLSQGK
jgi:hypothetical protein